MKPKTPEDHHFGVFLFRNFEVPEILIFVSWNCVLLREITKKSKSEKLGWRFLIS
jgi:hypothetical protein